MNCEENHEADGEPVELLTMTFDEPGVAVGTLTLRRGYYGPTLLINGKEVGFLDFFEAAQSPAPGVPQLHFFDTQREGRDEPLAKVVLEEAGLVVVVNRDAGPGYTRQTTHHEGDRMFAWPPEPTEEAT